MITPLELLALGGVAILLLLIGGLVVLMLRSLDRHDRYLQASKRDNRVAIDTVRGPL